MCIRDRVQREETMIVVIDDGCGEDIVYTRIYQMIEEIGGTVLPVSYTHLDVYKRQEQKRGNFHQIRDLGNSDG